MTFVSSRDDRQLAAGHLLRCADRADPGHRLISKDANFTNACTGSFGPNRPRHLPTGCSRSLHRMSVRARTRAGTQARDASPGRSSNPPTGHRDAKSRSTPQAAADRDVRQTRTAVLQVANLAIPCAGELDPARGRTHPETDRCGRGIKDPTSPQTRGRIFPRHMASVAPNSGSGVGKVRRGVSAGSSERRDYGRYDAGGGRGCCDGRRQRWGVSPRRPPEHRGLPGGQAGATRYRADP